MRSELFEETLKQHKDSLTDELEQLGKHRQAQLVEWDIEQNESDYEFYFNAGWNAQQSKVDELQKQNAWLSGVANRENKRANKLQEEKVSTTALLGKTIQEKNELQKRVDDLTELNRLKTIALQQSVNRTSPYVHEKIVALEQALKGGFDASN